MEEVNHIEQAQVLWELASSQLNQRMTKDEWHEPPMAIQASLAASNISIAQSLEKIAKLLEPTITVSSGPPMCPDCRTKHAQDENCVRLGEQRA